MLEELKNFALRGNVIELAVGFIMGAAFNKVVQSLVNDVLMPPISYLTGGVRFENLFIAPPGYHFRSLAAAEQAGIPTLNYGDFIDHVIEFMVVAIAMFVLVQQVNMLYHRDTPMTDAKRMCPFCRSMISARASRCPNCTQEVDPLSP